MGFFQRLASIFQAKANKVLDRVEDPRETLDLSYEKQLEMLQKLKRSLADVATARKRLELQAQQIQSEAEKLQNQAKQALSINREDLAREALTRRAALASQLESLKTQHDELVQQEEKISNTVHDLEVKVEAFRTQKETIKANYTAAEAQTRINEVVAGISKQMGDVGLAMQRAQDKVAQMQARAGALDDLLSTGALEPVLGGKDDISRELEQATSQSQVDQELQALKSQLALEKAASVTDAESAKETEVAQASTEEPSDNTENKSA